MLRLPLSPQRRRLPALHAAIPSLRMRWLEGLLAALQQTPTRPRPPAPAPHLLRTKTCSILGWAHGSLVLPRGQVSEESLRTLLRGDYTSAAEFVPTLPAEPRGPLLASRPGSFLPSVEGVRVASASRSASTAARRRTTCSLRRPSSWPPTSNARGRPFTAQNSARARTADSGAFGLRSQVWSVGLVACCSRPRHGRSATPHPSMCLSGPISEDQGGSRHAAARVRLTLRAGRDLC